MNFIEFISQPWHWSVSGFMIVVVLFLLLYLGQRFGVSSSFEAMCSMAGLGNKVEYFKVDWRQRTWLLVFLLGTIIGGAIAGTLLANPEPIDISAATIADLETLGVDTPKPGTYMPEDIFNFQALGSLKGFIIMVIGGFFIGFGTRWAGGCTSGHAISGLANLQLPSLVAVIGFFIGGLVMTHFLLPIILNL